MTRAGMTQDQAMRAEAILLAVGVVLIAVGVRSSDWPLLGAGVLALLVFSGAFVIVAVKLASPDASSSDGVQVIIARPVTWLTLTGIVLLTACLAEFALGLIEMRWIPCTLSVAAAAQASLAYLLSSAAQSSNRSDHGRTPGFGRIERLALSLYAMALVLLALTIGQF